MRTDFAWWCPSTMLTCTAFHYFRQWPNSHDWLLFIFFICILRFVLHLALAQFALSIPCGVVCSFTLFLFALKVHSGTTVCFGAASHGTWQYQCLHANLLWAKLRMMVIIIMERQWHHWRASRASVASFLLPISCICPAAHNSSWSATNQGSEEWRAVTSARLQMHACH